MLPNKGEQNQRWLPHPCLLGGPKGAEMLRHSYILGDPQTKGGKIRSEAPSPLPSRGPTSGWKCYVTPAFPGIPKTMGVKIRSGHHTPAFSGAQ